MNEMDWNEDNGAATFRDVFDVNNVLDFHNAKTQIIGLFMNTRSSVTYRDIENHTGLSKAMIVSVCQELKRDGLITTSSL